MKKIPVIINKYKEQDHSREMITLQPRQCREFDNEIEAKHALSHEVNQLHFAITPKRKKKENKITWPSIHWNRRDYRQK